MTLSPEMKAGWQQILKTALSGTSEETLRLGAMHPVSGDRATLNFGRASVPLFGELGLELRKCP